MNHMFNLIKITQQTMDERECIVCFNNKANAILKCGHYLLCKGCVKHVAPKCPLCKVDFCRTNPVENIDYFECHKFQDELEFDCCDAHDKDNTQKVQTIYTPCGHANVQCTSCRSPGNNVCPVCHKEGFANLKYFI